MKLIRAARAIGGLVSILVLLGLLSAHVLHPEVEMSVWVVGTLLTLIGGLLAVDELMGDIPTITIGFDTDDE